MKKKPWAYYNEHDKSAAAWLRELIKEGVITDGTVDERSIEDVVPAELAEFDRCHFFAGVGVWDYALTRAGWGDRKVWTGSCPCQPFSAAGKQDGFDDARHLWPVWFRLIEQCRPETIFGEQIASSNVIGRASNNPDHLRSLWEREELRKLSHPRFTSEISRDLLRLSERAGAETQIIQPISNGTTTKGLAANASSLCPCVVRSMSGEGEESGFRFGYGSDSTADRHWQVRNVGNQIRFGRGLEQSLFGPERPDAGLYDVECPRCHHGFERDDESMGSGESYGDCGCVEEQNRNQEEERAILSLYAGELPEEDGGAWFDLISDDLERLGYTVGANSSPACGVGAPHIRQRLYFVADAGCGTSERNAGSILRAKAEIGRENGQLNGNSSVGFTDGRSTHELAKPVSVGRRGRRERPDEREIRDGGRSEVQIEGSSEFSRLDDSGGDEHRPDRGTPRETDSLSELNRSSGLSGRIVGASGDGHGQLGDSDRERSQRLRADDGTQGRQDSQRPFGLPDGAIWPGPTNGFWRDAEWIYCRDGKWRPVGTIESGAFEMADELAADLGCMRDQSSGNYTISPLIEKGKARVSRLRGYGNAIVAEVAIAFIESYLELER